MGIPHLPRLGRSRDNYAYPALFPDDPPKSRESALSSHLCNFSISGSGYYAYIETSWPRKTNDTARLISSSVPGTTGTTGKCLTFWYHMYGADINRLSVYVRTGQPGSQHDTRLWNKAGAQGDRWIQAKATATARSSFQVPCRKSSSQCNCCFRI